MTPIAQEILEEMQRHAIEEYPNECCGILIGKPEGPEHDVLHRCRNIQNQMHEKFPDQFVRDARTAFYIDPKELMGILKEAETRGLQIKTFYHSHPDHDAYFSEEDRNMALYDEEPVYPGANYLVISVYDREVRDQALFAWDQRTKTFKEQTI